MVSSAHPLNRGDVEVVLLSGVEHVGQVEQLAVAAGIPEVPLTVLPKILRLRQGGGGKGQQKARKENNNMSSGRPLVYTWYTAAQFRRELTREEKS